MPRQSIHTIQKAFDETFRRRWRHLSSWKTQHKNGMQAVSFFGPDRRVDTITSKDLDDYQLDLRDLRYRPATINKKLTALGTILKDEARRGHIESVPVAPPLLKENNVKDRVITPAEEEAFALYFRKVGAEEASRQLTFMINTLSRWGDVERLHVCDLHLDRKPRAEVTFRNRKNTGTDTIVLPEQARQAVMPLLHGKEASDLVFSYSYYDFRVLFNEAKAFMGLADDRALTIHCTRHTGASRLAAKNCSLNLIMAMGGWRSLQNVKRYMHHNTAALQQVAAMLEG